MKTLLPITVLSLAPAMLAQTVTVTGKALTPLAVVAKAGNQTAHDAAAKDSTYKPYRPIRASARVQLSNGRYASASTIAQCSPFQPLASIFERHYAQGMTADSGGTSASPTANGAKPGPHSVLITFTGKANTKGVVTLSFVGRMQNATTACFNKGELDVGNDGKVEWKGGGSGSQSARKEFAASFDGNGRLVVKATTESIAFGTNDPRDFVHVSSELWVGFKSADQGKCDVVAYGKSCGPKLDAAIAKIGNNNVIVWKLSNAFKNAFSVNVIGSQAINLNLGGGCSLLSNAIVLVLVQTDGNGEWKASEILPLRNFTTYHQSLPIDLVNGNLVLKASNGLRLTCSGF